MTKYTLELKDEWLSSWFMDQLDDTNSPLQKAIHDQIKEQLPKPVPEEPTGDVLVVFGSAVFRPVAGGHAYWRSVVTGDDYIWSDLVSRWSQYEPVVYDRRDETVYCNHGLEVEDCALADGHQGNFRHTTDRFRWHITKGGLIWLAEDEEMAGDSPPTEEVADADELMVRAGFSPKPVEELVGVLTDPAWKPAEADPLEALIYEYTHAAGGDAAEFWTHVQWRKHHDEFADRVRALTTEDTVPAHELHAIYDSWLFGGGTGEFKEKLNALLSKAGQ